MTRRPMIQRQGCFTAASLGPRAWMAVGYVMGRTTMYSVKAARNESAAVANAGLSSTPMTTRPAITTTQPQDHAAQRDAEREVAGGHARGAR